MKKTYEDGQSLNKNKPGNYGTICDHQGLKTQKRDHGKV